MFSGTGNTFLVFHHLPIKTLPKHGWIWKKTKKQPTTYEHRANGINVSIVQRMQKSNPNTKPPNTELKVAEKLNFHNYTKWCRLNADCYQREGTAQSYHRRSPKIRWPNIPTVETADSMVIFWIVSNINSDLINQFLDYTTARDLWKGIETLLGSGRDELQIYDLSS